MTRLWAPLPGEIPAVMICVAASTFLCVPETDHIDEVAVALGVVLVLELFARRPFGLAVATVQVSAVLAAGLYGATGRDSATVGAVFSFWPIALAALAVAGSRRIGNREQLNPWRRIAIEIVGVAAAVTVARTGALHATVGPAITSVAVAVAISVLCAGVICVARQPSAS